MKRLILVFIVGTLAFVPLWSQSAENMDKIIGNPSVAVDQASYLVFVAAGKLAEDATFDQSFTLYNKMGWLGTEGNPHRAITLAEYAYLLQRSFDLPRGVMATLLPGPRYAFRDFVFSGLIAPDVDPDSYVTGAEAVRLLGKIMDTLPAGVRS